DRNFLLNCVRTATVSGARNHVSLIRRPVVPVNPTRWGSAAMAAGPKVAIPTRFSMGLACGRPSWTLFHLDAAHTVGVQTKRLQQGRNIRLCVDTCICAARLGSGPLRR